MVVNIWIHKQHMIIATMTNLSHGVPYSPILKCPFPVGNVFPSRRAPPPNGRPARVPWLAATSGESGDSTKRGDILGCC